MPHRREFLRSLAAGGFWLAVPGAFCDEIAKTPSQTEGPFYPDHLPLDTDNDLIIVSNSLTPAVGTIVHLGGRLLTTSGEPIRNATIEIWQVDSNGAYLHSRSTNHDRRDRNFQGFGRFETGSTGEYRFRTVKPVPYDTRTPHIHFAINRNGRRVLTTQLYIKGEPLNERDFILRAMRDPKDRQMLMRDFRPVPGSRIGELAASFDIVIGETPEDAAVARRG